MKFIALLLLLLSGPTLANELSGQVVGISDGDTLTLLNSANTQVKVRLAAIDAPEKAQAFGNRAKQALSGLCFGKPATVKVMDMDRYGRTVGEVICAGTNANAAMIERGMAWVYRKYAEGYGHLFPIEGNARQARLGLWADPDPVPPWEWRKANRGQ